MWMYNVTHHHAMDYQENAMEEIFFIIVKKYYLSRPVIELVYIVFWLSAKPI